MILVKLSSALYVSVFFLPSLSSGTHTRFPRMCFWCVSVCIESYTSCVCLGAATLLLLPNNCRLFTLWYRTLERECSPWPRWHCVLLRGKAGKDWEGVWGMTLHWVLLYPFLPLHSSFIFFKNMCLLWQGNTYFSWVLSDRVQCSQISSEHGYQFRCLNGSQCFRNPISSLGVEHFWQ